MSYSIPIPNGILCTNDDEFDCPYCGKHYTSDFYEKQLQNSKYGLIRKKCRGCVNKIGITVDITGDVVIWQAQ